MQTYLKEGPGIFQLKGNFVNNLRHGHGKMKFVDGSVYEGQWGSGEQHGSGTLVAADGKKEVGEWKQGQMQGV